MLDYSGIRGGKQIDCAELEEDRLLLCADDAVQWHFCWIRVARRQNERGRSLVRNGCDVEAGTGHIRNQENLRRKRKGTCLAMGQGALRMARLCDSGSLHPARLRDRMAGWPWWIQQVNSEKHS